MINQTEIVTQQMKLSITDVLKCNLCDYNDAYILVRSDITVATQVAFKNGAPFTRCITKIDGTTIDDAEDLDTAGSLWFYSKDKATKFNADIVNTNAFKCFKYKAKLLENTVAQPAPNQTHEILKNATIAAPLQCLINFRRLRKMPLINCKVELKFRLTKYYVLFVIGVANIDNDDGANVNNIIFTTKDTKLYDPVVTSSAKDNQQLSKLLSKGFERSVYWNEYKTKSENKDKTNGYKHFLESNFVIVSRLFVLVYSNQDDNSRRYKAKKDIVYQKVLSRILASLSMEQLL